MASEPTELDCTEYALGVQQTGRDDIDIRRDCEGILDNGTLDELLTIVVVTSPTHCHPSTEMIDRVLASLVLHWPSLSSCKVIIACDGYEELDEATLQKRSSRRGRIMGRVSAELARRYDDYCTRLEERSWLQVLRLQSWQGFALALRSAVNLVTTPAVFVLPHDFEISNGQGVNLTSMVSLVLSKVSSPVRYVGLPNSRTLQYARRHKDALDVVNVAGSLQEESNEKNEHVSAIVQHGGIDLLPLLMWKENPHIAAVDTYKELVFGDELHVFKRGQFIEETFGQRQLEAIKSGSSSHDAFGTFLLHREASMTYHLDGKRYIDVAQRVANGWDVPVFESDRATNAHTYVEARASNTANVHC